MAGPISFLNLQNVLEIHENSIRHEGGLGGMRDIRSLQSAIAMPRQQFAGQYLHEDLAAMAAAYLYHLCQNHPFHDGNKRTAALSALVFLRDNNCAPLPSANDLEQITMAVASGQMTKPELIDWMREKLA